MPRKYTCSECGENGHSKRFCPHSKKTCNICFEMKKTTETKCKHNFCKSCLQSWCKTFERKTKRPNCPCCRKEFTDGDLKNMKIPFQSQVQQISICPISYPVITDNFDLYDAIFLMIQNA